MKHMFSVFTCLLKFKYVFSVNRDKSVVTFI